MGRSGQVHRVSVLGRAFKLRASMRHCCGMKPNLAALTLSAALLAVIPVEAQQSPAIADGLRDRTSFEDWYGSLTGDYQAGAAYWAAHRSVPKEAVCRGTGPVLEGCVAAKARLGPFDSRRKIELDYKVGWNSYEDDKVGEDGTIDKPAPVAVIKQPEPNLPDHLSFYSNYSCRDLVLAHLSSEYDAQAANTEKRILSWLTHRLISLHPEFEQRRDLDGPYRIAELTGTTCAEDFTSGGGKQLLSRVQDSAYSALRQTSGVE